MDVGGEDIEDAGHANLDHETSNLWLSFCFGIWYFDPVNWRCGWWWWWFRPKEGSNDDLPCDWFQIQGPWMDIAAIHIMIHCRSLVTLLVLVSALSHPIWGKEKEKEQKKRNNGSIFYLQFGRQIMTTRGTIFIKQIKVHLSNLEKTWWNTINLSISWW